MLAVVIEQKQKSLLNNSNEAVLKRWALKDFLKAVSALLQHKHKKSSYRSV